MPSYALSGNTFDVRHLDRFILKKPQISGAHELGDNFANPAVTFGDQMTNSLISDKQYFNKRNAHTTTNRYMSQTKQAKEHPYIDNTTVSDSMNKSLACRKSNQFTQSASCIRPSTMFMS